MASSSLDYGRSFGSWVQSAPIPVHWAGWKSTTYDLQRAGWEVSVHQDVVCMQMCIAIRHEGYGAHGMSRVSYDWPHFRNAEQAGPRMLDSIGGGLTLGLEVGRTVNVVIDAPLRFTPVDCTPRVADSFAIRSLEDFAHFAPLATPEQQFIIEDADVDDLLARILEKQQAAKTEHFRQIAREATSPLPSFAMSAQIITLKAA